MFTIITRLYSKDIKGRAHLHTPRDITNSVKPLSKILFILYKKAIIGKYQRSIYIYTKFL